MNSPILSLTDCYISKSTCANSTTRRTSLSALLASPTAAIGPAGFLGLGNLWFDSATENHNFQRAHVRPDPGLDRGRRISQSDQKCVSERSYAKRIYYDHLIWFDLESMTRWRTILHLSTHFDIDCVRHVWLITLSHAYSHIKNRAYWRSVLAAEHAEFV